MTQEAIPGAAGGSAPIRAFERIFGPGSQGRFRLAALLVSLISVMRTAFAVLPHWREMRGGEAYWVAQSLVLGGGYSFPDGHAWLIDFVDNNQALRVVEGVFHVTAWTDPFYTFCLAGLIWMFGEYHQLAAALFNLVLLLAVYGVTYRLTERLISASAGVLAVTVLALGVFADWNAPQMYHTILAALLVVSSSLVFVNVIERPSGPRAAGLGLALGVTVLGCPSALLFIPVAAATLAMSGRKNLDRAVRQAALVVVVAVVTMLPWTIRNYLAFGEFVPGRTGLGQIVFVGVVGAGGAVEPDRLHSRVKPPWRAPTARSAVQRLAAFPWDDEAALQRFQLEYAREVWAGDWATLNEAQRDARFLRETEAFLLANPVLSVQLAIAKLEVFGRSSGRVGSLVFLLAALGAVLSVRRAQVFSLALLVGTYLPPYLLAVAYYARYRGPIEPLLTVLATYALWQAHETISRRLRAG